MISHNKYHELTNIMI